MPTTILHLSDVHYGNDFIPWAVMHGRGFTKRPTQALVNGLREAISELRPDFVVISGDFVNKAKAGCFSAAAEFLNQLLTSAGVDVQRQVLLIPGNHDVSFSRKERDSDRLALFQTFIDEFFKQPVHRRAGRFLIRDDQKQLIFLGLDTTLKTLSPRAEGEIGREQLKWAKEKIERTKSDLGAEYERYAKIAIMHHHCVPIPGGSAKNERSMQLLDAEGIMSLLKADRFDVVLHGHKHVPNITKVLREDGGVMTVVGAGTVLAPYPDQQGGYGNNFNVIELDHAALEVRVSRYHAREDGSFEKLVGPESQPLFKVVTQGFNTRKVRRIARVASNGDTEITLERRGIRATGTNRIRTLPVRISLETPGARIRSFDLRASEGTVMDWKIQEDQMFDGFTVFARDRTSRDGEISLIYDYVLERATRMSQADARQRFVGQIPLTEETGVSVTSEVDELEIVVAFPLRYAAQVEAVFERNGVNLDRDVFGNRYTLNYDEALNQWTFEMTNPPLHHRINLVWSLPADWTQQPLT